jgi:predicted AAA+ superfamily ATPase
MSHLRDRHVTHAFEKLCAHSPLVGIFGHRQVGKTTFLETKTTDSISLDDKMTQKWAEESPSEFLRARTAKRSAIDECQLAPALFPALKLWVQKQKRPGQFILSGSVRFTSRRAIRESLTGRLASVELFPLVLSEIRSDVLPDFLPRALAASSFSGFKSHTPIASRIHTSHLKDYQTYLELGGLPGLCFVRDSQTRSRMLQDILRTLLDRDLRLVHETPLPYSDIIAFCSELARTPLEPFSATHASRAVGLAPRTIQHLLQAFEALFLVRRLPIEGGGRSGFLILFEDQLEQNFLAQNRLTDLDKQVGLLYRNARAQFEYRLGATPTYFHFRTRGGSTIPLAIRTEHGVLGLMPRRSQDLLTRADRASFKSFLSAYSNSKVLVITDSPDERDFEALSDRVLIAPVTAVF